MKWLIAILITIAGYLVVDYFGLRESVSELRKVEAELTKTVNQLKADNSSLRTQYRVIDDVLTLNVDAERRIDTKTVKLKRDIADVQNSSSKSVGIVPAIINDWLRERVTEVNATATNSGSSL